MEVEAMIEQIKEALGDSRMSGKQNLSHTDLNDRKKWITYLGTWIFELAGQISDHATELIIAKGLDSELTTRYPYFTRSEVELILTLGVKGEFEKYSSINAITVANWMRIYFNSPERRKAKGEINKISPEEQNKPTDTEIEQLLRNAALSKYHRFLEGKQYFDYGSSTYDYLVKRGALVLTEEVRSQIYSMALQEVAQESGMPRGRMNDQQKLENELGLKVTANNRAKKIGLQQYFFALQEQNIKLEELI